MKASSVNQDLMVNIELSSFFSMKGASVVLDVFEDVMDVVIYCSHSVKLLLCSEMEESL